MTAVDLGRPLATGRTAEIYAWPDGRILKLYFDWFGLDSIRSEQRLAQTVHASGLPVPAVGELLQVNGRNGLVYERVAGRSMQASLLGQPWRLAAFARRLADQQAGMHSNPARPALPSQRDRLENKLRRAAPLTESRRSALLAALVQLPEGSSICHGDFHPDNLLLDRGRVAVIDWMDASLGNPLADVARTTVILLGSANASPRLDPVRRIFIEAFHAIYLRRYFLLRPGGRDEYLRWLPVVAAARLSENIPALEAWLLKTAGDR